MEGVAVERAAGESITRRGADPVERLADGEPLRLDLLRGVGPHERLEAVIVGHERAGEDRHVGPGHDVRRSAHRVDDHDLLRSELAVGASMQRHRRPARRELLHAARGDRGQRVRVRVEMVAGETEREGLVGLDAEHRRRR